MRFFTTLRVELVEGPHHPRAIDHSAQFAQFNRQRTAIYQPLWRWQPYGQRLEAEPISPRARHEDLHRYRVGFQTVGQPRWLWAKTPQPADLSYSVTSIDHGGRFALFARAQAAAAPASSGVVESPGFSIVPFDDEIRQPQHSLFPFRQIAIAAAATQPFWIWPAAPDLALPVDDMRHPQHDALFALRGVAPVAPQASQPWWIWQAPEPQLLERADFKQPRHDLFALRSQAQQPAQPWFIYRTTYRVDAEQAALVVPNHSALFALRSVDNSPAATLPSDGKRRLSTRAQRRILHVQRIIRTGDKIIY